MGSYVLDFYCPDEHLALELDGNYHYTLAGTDYDGKRTKYVESLNIRILRVENKLVFEQLDWVLSEIIRRHFRKV